MSDLAITTLDEFKSVYKIYRTTLLDIYYTHAKHTNLNRVNHNLESIISASIQGKDSTADLSDLHNYPYYDVHEFLVLVLYSASNKTLGVDSNRLKALNFGFTDCADILQSLRSVLGDSASKVITDEILSSLYSIGRNEDYTQYIEKKHYCADLLNIKDLLDSSKRRIGADSDELNALIGQTFYQNINSALNLIKARYSYILEGTFGVDNYKGIYTGKTPAVMQGVSNGSVKVIDPDSDFATQFKPIFDGLLDITLYSDAKGSNTNGRQFDTDLISKSFGLSMDSKSVKPIYFPLKVLELISKCGYIKKQKKEETESDIDTEETETIDYTFTTKTQLLNYNKLPESVIGTKEQYLNKIVEYFEDEIIDYIYKCVLNYCKSCFSEVYTDFKSEVDSSIVDPSEKQKQAKSIKDINERHIIDILEERKDVIASSGTSIVGYSTLLDYIRASLNYYVDCVTTAIVLDKCETEKAKGFGGSIITKILEFRIKICSRLTSANAFYTNEQFIDSLVKICKINASDMADVESTRAVVDEQGFSMVDVKYTFNIQKVNARPTFAYKALTALMEQQDENDRKKGIPPVSWQNILLGRSLNDKIITSSENSDIQLQKNQVHWVFAGSRAGKGVMCYNLFATAVGGKIPIFYIDRKPDTATVLSALCPDMFCVNGGQYDPTIDTAGVFAPSTYNFNIPTYLSGYFTNEADKFDFVYFRSILLVLAMFDYADTYKDSPLGQKLIDAFSGGVVLVLDEFSNFVRDFLAKTKPMSASSGSWLSKARSQKGILQDLQDVTTGVKKAKIAKVRTENKKNVTEEEIAMAQEVLDVAESAEFELDKVYWAAIADSYQAIKDNLAGKKDAAGAVAKSMQIFIIGQDLDKIEIALGESDWFNTGAAGNTLKFNKSDDIIPLVHLFSKLSTDVIAGYQKDRQSYLAQADNKFKTANLLNANRRCFAYKSFGDFSKAELAKLTHTVDTLKGNEQNIKNYLDNWAYFKPFLILNNAEEPPERVRYKDFCSSPTKRENIRKGLKTFEGETQDELLACKNSQYVGQCLCSCENAGLTWDDLLADNDDGTGHLDKRVGFEGYISQLAGGIPVDSMSLSGQLANEFIQTVYGYQGDWKQFICDFRPEWIVSTKGYTQDGTRNIVQDRLADSFFFKELLALKPAENLGNKLESLLPYYGAVSSEELSTLDSETYGSYYDENEEGECATTQGYSSSTQDYQNPAQYDNQTTSSNPLTDEGQFQREHFGTTTSSNSETSDKPPHKGWSDDDRWAIADNMITAYLMGVKSVDVVKYNKLSHPNLRPCLNEMMYNILLQLGY